MADNDDDGLFSPPNYRRYALSGKIMLGAIVLLLCVVIIMICLHLYVRLYLIPTNRRQTRRRSRRRTPFVFSVDNRNVIPSSGSRTGTGLPESVVKSLPVFVYSSKTHTDQIDCSVCLSEFEENEVGKIIPKCNHSFHVSCIDTWFYSHDTCPLCRSTVVVEPGSGLDKPDESVVDFGGQVRIEPGSSSGSCGSDEESVAVEVVVVVPTDDEVGTNASSKITTSFVKSLSFKRIMNRDKRESVSPSVNGRDGIGS